MIKKNMKSLKVSFWRLEKNNENSAFIVLALN